MAENSGNFRTRILGGFDRLDVIKYIEKLAAERNDCRSELEKLKEEIQALTDDNDALRMRNSDLRRELSECRAKAEQQSGQNALDETAKELEQLRRDMTELFESIKKAVDSSNAGFRGVYPAIDMADARISNLQNRIAALREEL
ncbi:MAG: DUF972 family protein [Oscillospiraceae bacterium]|nr:DUF972 family protein [Oscillospiraceae bacterium]